MAHLRVLSFKMAVIKHDQIAWDRGYGHFEFQTSHPVTAETAFQAASMSKAIAAFGALVVAERGPLDLDAPVNEYLTRLANPGGREESGRPDRCADTGTRQPNHDCAPCRSAAARELTKRLPVTCVDWSTPKREYTARCHTSPPARENW